MTAAPKCRCSDVERLQGHSYRHCPYHETDRFYVRRRCVDDRCGVTLVYPRDQVPDEPKCHRCRRLEPGKSTAHPTAGGNR